MKSIGFLLASILMLSIVPPTCAQDGPRQYKKFDISPEFEKRFEERLQMEKQLSRLKNLIKQIAADPSKMPINPSQLDDNLKKALKDWATNDPQLRDALKDWLKQNPPGKLPDDMKKFQEEMTAILDKPPKIDPVKAIELPKAKIDPAKPKAEPLAKAAERAMKRAENTKFGDWLRDSPAWNRAFEDLRSSINSPDAAQFKMGDWPSKLPDGDGFWNLGQGTLERLRGLPTPDLGRWTPSLPTFAGLPAPDISAPSLPAGPSMPSVGTWGTWLLFAAISLLVAWQMLRWSKRSSKAPDGRAKLGPWPVQPDAVSTRAQLVQAFDYLALLTLGLGVQCWNHHAVARKWRTQAPTCAASAHTLASLYEQARYTDGVEPLKDTDRDQARRLLLQLAEAL